MLILPSVVSRALCRLGPALFCTVLVVAVILLMDDTGFAQAVAPRHMPFGIGGAEGAATAPTNVLANWLLALQSAFYQKITSAVSASKANGTAVWTLSGLSLAYGVFHAAGPGHGKAVIASYMFANESALKRGTAIAFAAAAVQGLVAVAIIGLIAVAFHGTAKQMTAAAGEVELVSYAAIAGFGLWLVWRKGRAFLRLALPASAAPAGPHIHGSDCDHVHMPNPADLDRPFSTRDFATTVFAAGIRPCTGAILVLVFTLSQGIFLVGILAVAAMSFGTAVTTSAIAALAVFAKMLALRFASGASRRSELILRGLELGAAIFVTLLGFALFFGYLIGEGGA
jgi:nickel/cobalt transporter (NicO) family protein